MGRTQHQLAHAVSQEFGLTARAGRRLVRRLVQMVADDLVATGRIELRGLGTFSVHHRAAKETAHPQTSEPLTIPARRSVQYRASRALRRRLNPGS